jgi:hypothetical protein
VLELLDRAIPAASPITKPSARRRDGREPRSGSSFRLEIALMAPKPAMLTRVTGASVPPQIITSARPSRIASMPSPIAMFEAAQAVHWERSGPLVPSSIETQPAARFGMIWTIENGLTRSGPRSLSWSTHASKDFSPPIPVATAAPTRSAIGAITRPESVSA